jgi:uncharacterized membrane protein
MSTVDVTAEVEIAAAPADIAAVMFDPAREPEWMQAVTKVEVIDPALVRGARVRHSGSFLGKEIAWVTEVETVHFPHVLALRMQDGPFAGSVRYEIQRSSGGSVARIRTVGEPTSFGFLPAAMIAAPMRKALDADLGRLKAIVETPQPTMKT